MFSAVFVLKCFVCVCVFQLKYKADVQENSSNLYSLMPETLDTQFAKHNADLQSDV